MNLAVSASHLADLASVVRAINSEKGWRDQSRTLVEDLCLIHSEVSEALEAWRALGHVGPMLDETIVPAKPYGVGSELADVLIRLLDTCDRFGINLAAELVAKIEYNKTRPHRHGGKHI